MSEATSPTEFLERIGGAAAIKQLAAEFYRGVASDPVMVEMYPEVDLGPAQERLELFLLQYWGGPTTYSDQRGHPRLRMRHAPFYIDDDARDRWLKHMRAGLDSLALSAEDDEVFWDYLVRAAHAMVNVNPAFASGPLRLHPRGN